MGEKSEKMKNGQKAKIGGKLKKIIFLKIFQKKIVKMSKKEQNDEKRLYINTNHEN